MKIGFFDSGLGGLTVMKAVALSMPQYDYEFYGDTANLPYGDKTEEDI
jgi:glutamate racemase